MGHVRHTVHHDLQRNGDLLLDLLGRDSRPLRYDLHVIVRDVGIGFHGKLVERNRAPSEQQQRRREYEKTVLECEINELANHLLGHPYCSTVFWNTSAFDITRSPDLIPRTTSCMLPGSIFPAFTSSRRKRPFPNGV